ncbi:MAG: T9SS type A sorting domain-containing protein [Bacteroidetes bacterium]|nr:T9SS type A sorting domain-containing protein [Bacteroidota bacterium]
MPLGLLKKYWLVVFLCCLSKHIQAQNLAPNGNFEQYSTCPTGLSSGTMNCTIWQRYTGGTPDYFHACGSGQGAVPINGWGNQGPISGSAYIAVGTYNPSIPNYKEYITAPIAPLQINSVYEVSMSVSLADKSRFATNDLGVLFFDKGPMYGTSYMSVVPVSPQVSYSAYGPITDSVNWLRVTANFIADSAYTNIVIGGFKDTLSMIGKVVGGNGNYAMYYIDSVVLRQVNLALNYTNTKLCTGDTAVVPYMVTPGHYGMGNVFTLQLSDSGGNFSAPLTLASVNSTTSGVMKGVIPNFVLSGSRYRLRIVSSLPADTSTDNAIDIAIGNSRPIPKITANSPVCYNDTFKISASSTTPITQYYWNGPGMYERAFQSFSKFKSDYSDTGTYVLRAEYYGCVAYDSVKLYIKPLPVKPGIIHNTPLCEGDTLKLSSNGGSSGAAFMWKGPGPVTCNGKDMVIANVTQANAGLYVVSASSNGCSSHDSINVIVKQVPKVSAGADTMLCAGSTMYLSATDTLTNAAYTWTGPAGFNIVVKDTVLYNVDTSMSGIYRLKVTSANGCASYDDVIISINNYPLKPLASSNSPVCEKDALLLLTSHVQPGVSYTWTGPAGYTSTVINNTVQQINNNAAGRYVIKANNKGCMSTDTVDVVVKPLPNVPDISSNSPLVEGEDLYLQLRNPQTGVGYLWTGPDNFKSTSKNHILFKTTYQRAGTYIMTATLNGCSVKSSINVTINELSDTGSFVLFPNPNDGNFTLLGLLKQDETVTLRITTSAGQTVYEMPVATDRNHLVAYVNLKDALASGVYTLHVIMADDKKYIRFVVDRDK